MCHAQQTSLLEKHVLNLADRLAISAILQRVLQFSMRQLGRVDPLSLQSQQVEMTNPSDAPLAFKASWMKSFSVVMTTKRRTALRSPMSLPRLLRPLQRKWLHGGPVTSPLLVGSQLLRLGRECRFLDEWLHEPTVNHRHAADHLVHLHLTDTRVQLLTAACHQVQLPIKVSHCQQVGQHLELNHSLGSSRQYK